MKSYYYVGLDIHKKTISYCVKLADGSIVKEGKIASTRCALRQWTQGIESPWCGGMEATIFSGWIYDFLLPYANELKVGHPFMIKAITSAKHKSDRRDACTLADLLRCDLFPECYMAPSKIRELRRILRYRNILVQESTRMKNKASGLLMEVGAEYNKSKLHGKRYYSTLLEELDNLNEIPTSVIELLKFTRTGLELFDNYQKILVNALCRHPELNERVELLRSIQGVGQVTALTWALEIGDPHRFSSNSKTQSYCGLCSGENVSAGKSKRGPLSKQRNKHLQTMLIEAAKLAPRWNPQLAWVYEKERADGGDHNQATLAVARKLVAYLMYVDKNRKEFKLRETA